MGSIYIKSVKHLKWDRLLFAGQWSNDDEITLFTYSNHLFSGKYKLFFAFDQISVVYLSFHLDLKFDHSLLNLNFHINHNLLDLILLLIL